MHAISFPNRHISLQFLLWIVACLVWFFHHTESARVINQIVESEHRNRRRNAQEGTGLDLRAFLNRYFDYGCGYAESSIEEFGPLFRETYNNLVRQAKRAKHTPDHDLILRLTLYYVYIGAFFTKRLDAMAFLVQLRFISAYITAGCTLDDLESLEALADQQHEGAHRYILDDLIKKYPPDARTDQWYAIYDRIQAQFLGIIRSIDSPKLQFNMLYRHYAAVSTYESSTTRTDFFARKIIQQYLELLHEIALRTKQFRDHWAVLVQAYEYGHTHLILSTEAAIQAKIPDLNGRNMKQVAFLQLIFGVHLTPFSRYRKQIIGGGGTERREYFLGLLASTQWLLADYIEFATIMQLRNSAVDRIIMAKIEERLLPLVGTIEPSAYPRIINALKEIGMNTALLGRFIRYGTDPALRKLGLYAYEQYTKTMQIEKMGIFFQSHDSPEWKQMVAFYFDVAYLEIIDRKRRGEVVPMYEDSRYLLINSETAKELYDLVWSDECRTFLKRKINKQYKPHYLLITKEHSAALRKRFHTLGCTRYINNRTPLTC